MLKKTRKHIKHISRDIDATACNTKSSADYLLEIKSSCDLTAIFQVIECVVVVLILAVILATV